MQSGNQNSGYTCGASQYGDHCGRASSRQKPLISCDGILSVGPNLHTSLVPFCSRSPFSVIFCSGRSHQVACWGREYWSRKKIGHGENCWPWKTRSRSDAKVEHVWTFATERTLGLKSENQGLATASNTYQPREPHLSIPNHSFLSGDIIPVLLCLPHFAVGRSNTVFMEIMLINIWRLWNCEVAFSSIQ